MNATSNVWSPDYLPQQEDVFEDRLAVGDCAPSWRALQSIPFYCLYFGGRWGTRTHGPTFASLRFSKPLQSPLCQSSIFGVKYGSWTHSIAFTEQGAHRYTNSTIGWRKWTLTTDLRSCGHGVPSLNYSPIVSKWHSLEYHLETHKQSLCWPILLSPFSPVISS